MPFRDVLVDEPAVAALPGHVLDDAFDLGRSLQHAHRAVDALDAVELPAGPASAT